VRAPWLPSTSSAFGRLPASVTWLLPTNVLLFVVLAGTHDRFLTRLNIDALLSNLAITVAISLGQMVVIAAGGMNLALGSIGALSGLATCYLMLHRGVPMVFSVCIGIAVGAAAGILNGFLVARFNLSAFIVTLATSSVFTGVALGLTQAQPLTPLPTSFTRIGTGTVGGVPTLFVLGVVVAALVAWICRFTHFGRQLLALGGNRDASALAGMPTRRVIVGVHVLSGVLAAWAGILTMARLGQGQPDIGSDWLLSSFAAPIIGGTLFAGGYLSVSGTVLGAGLLTLVSSAAVFVRINPVWVEVIQGLVVVGAAILDRTRIRRATRPRARRASAEPVPMES
jgi:ribose transport system permease protein